MIKAWKNINTAIVVINNNHFKKGSIIFDISIERFVCFQLKLFKGMYKSLPYYLLPPSKRTHQPFLSSYLSACSERLTSGETRRAYYWTFFRADFTQILFRRFYTELASVQNENVQ
jgi:hypothetical protein